VILNLHLSRSVFQQWKSEVSYNVSLFEIHREPTVLPHSIICVSHVNFAYRPMFCSFWKSWANNEIIFTGEFNFSII